MKGKLILCHVLCTAIGCIAGALAASGIGVFGGAVLAIVVAGVLGSIGISKVMVFDWELASVKSWPSIGLGSQHGAPSGSTLLPCCLLRLGLTSTSHGLRLCLLSLLQLELKST